MFLWKFQKNLEQNSFVTLIFVLEEKKGFLLQFEIAYSFLRDSKQNTKKYNYKPILVKMKQKKIDLETCLFLFWDNDDEPNMYRKSNFSRNPIFNLFFAFSDERMTDIFQEFTYCKN